MKKLLIFFLYFIFLSTKSYSNENIIFVDFDQIMKSQILENQLIMR